MCVFVGSLDITQSMTVSLMPLSKWSVWIEVVTLAEQRLYIKSIHLCLCLNRRQCPVNTFGCVDA